MFREHIHYTTTGPKQLTELLITTDQIQLCFTKPPQKHTQCLQQFPTAHSNRPDTVMFHKTTTETHSMSVAIPNCPQQQTRYSYASQNHHRSTLNVCSNSQLPIATDQIQLCFTKPPQKHTQCL